MVKFVAINGSLRTKSYSAKAIQIAIDLMEELGAEVQFLDLRTMNLPFCTGQEVYTDYPDVEKLRKTVKMADGLILATPEYHGSISGVIKNALDLMSFEQLSGKVAGLISVLGGKSNSNALNDLRLIMRWVHGWVIPEQIAIEQAYNAFSEDGKLIDAKLSERFQRFAVSLVENTQKLTQ